MKGKNLQPRILYPARLSFRFERRNQKLYRHAKVKTIQHHQTSFATNAKGNLGNTRERSKENKLPKMLIGSSDQIR